MSDSSPDELVAALADLSSAAKDEHERAEQDERDAVFAPLGDVLTSAGYARWQREQGELNEQGEG